MVRQRFSARKPGPTPREADLMADIRTLRRELAALRKAQDQRADLQPGDRLAGADRATLLIKIERIWRRMIQQLVPHERFCPTCGGISFERSEATFAQHAKDLREGRAA